MQNIYDYVIIGSGFGGSVSALRLSEKGYKVLVIEKGDWKKPGDFPETNWNLKKWLWYPFLGFRGIFKLTFFRHLSVISGVGVGGGSLVYANTLPIPEDNFYKSGSWNGLLEWKEELKDYYSLAKKMLGVSPNPQLFDGEKFLRKLADSENKINDFEHTDVGVFFGDSERYIPDPYFDGKGPERIGCSFCGKCMTGCNHGAKNTLDKNYLHLAQNFGAEILAGNFVTDVNPSNGEYLVYYRKSGSYFAKKYAIKTKGIIFAGGVLGSVPLLLKLRETSMKDISMMAGKDIRSNNESLIFVTSSEKEIDMSKGVAIGAIWKTNENSHLETVRYGSGSGFWRIGVLPMVTEPHFIKRLGKLFYNTIISDLGLWLKLYFVRNFAKKTIVLLYMEDLEGKLMMKRGKFLPYTKIQDGKPPNAFLENAHKLANKYGKMVKGRARTFFLESFSGIPSTAHILGGAVIGKNTNEGVIDTDHKLFGYENIYVCDGSAISANPGVNPSLTITAMTERAISKIPIKSNITT
jgi:cholesterol oxidase